MPALSKKVGASTKGEVMRFASCLGLVVFLTLAGSAAAQTTPALPGALPAVAMAPVLSSPVSLPVAAPALDFAKILGASTTEGTANGQVLVTAGCNFSMCRQSCATACHSIGCVPACDTVVCECSCVCP
jgi:hypothetical protein